MKKAISVISTIVITLMLLASCSPDTPEAPSQNTDVVLDESIQVVAVSGNDTVTLKGLKEGTLYGINPHGAQASSRAAGDTPFISTDGGTQLFLSDGSDVTFSGADVGIMGDGNVTVVEYVPQPDIDNDMLIDTTKEEYLYRYTDSQGRRCYVYEEYYPIRLNEVTGLKRNNVVQFRRYDGHGTSSTNYDIFYQEEGHGNLESIKKSGVLNLSSKDYDVIHVFNQVVLIEGEIQQEVFIENPVELEFEEQVTITDDNAVFLTGPTGLGADDEMAIEIGLVGNSIEDFDLNGRRIDSRLADGGLRKRYVFPLSYNKDENTVVLYAGPVEEEFVFEITTTGDVQPWTIKTRAVTEDEKNRIQHVDLNEVGTDGFMEVAIRFSASEWFTPVIFENDNGKYPDLSLLATYSDGGQNLMVVASSSGGTSVSSVDLRRGEAWSPDGQQLEYAVARNTSGRDGTINLTLSSESHGGPVQNELIVDASRLQIDEPSEQGNVDFGTTITFTNLVPGNVYGFNLGSGATSPNSRFIEVEDGFFIFLATSDRLEVEAAVFGIRDEVSLSCVSFEMQEDLEADLTKDRAIAETSDGHVVIDCFKLDVPGPGVYKIERSVSPSSRCTDYVFEMNGYWLNRLDGYTYVFDEGSYVFVQRTVIGEDPVMASFKLVEMQPLDEEYQDLDASSCYLLKASTEPTVLDMTFKTDASADDIGSLCKIRMVGLDESLFVDRMPLSVAQRSGQLYIGPHDEDLIVSFEKQPVAEPDSIRVYPLSDEQAAMMSKNKFIIDGDETLTVDMSTGMPYIRFIDQRVAGPLHFSATTLPEDIDVFISDENGYHHAGGKLDYTFNRNSGLQTICVAGYSKEPFVISIDQQ